ncbi:MAG: CDP-alcohol phosphatidyltransferase family protein [Phycisphaerae bacterium]
MKRLIYAITLSRLALAGVFAALVAAADAAGVSLAWAAGLVLLAIVEEVTDLADGYLARRFGLTTELGGLLDPLMDSLSRLTMYFALGLAGWVTVAVPLVMVLRDVVVGYTRIIQARIGGQTSARWSGKVKAIIQGGAVPVLIGLQWLARGRAEWAIVLQWITAGGVIAVTLWSLIDYLRGAWGGIAAMYRGVERKP